MAKRPEPPAARVAQTQGRYPGSTLLAHWKLKALLPSTGVPLFFLAYFALLDHPLFAVTTMPLTAFDRLIGFQPAAIFLYFSLWVYIIVPPGLLRRRGTLLYYYAGAAVLGGAGLAIYLLWPTAAPAVAVDWARYPGYRFLKSVDRTGNAMPSLHAAFTVFSGLWTDEILRRPGRLSLVRAAGRALNAAWGAGILWSTLATKQHVMVDLVAGIAFGGLVAGIHLHPPTWIRRFAVATSDDPGLQQEGFDTLEPDLEPDRCQDQTHEPGEDALGARR